MKKAVWFGLLLGFVTIGSLSEGTWAGEWDEAEEEYFSEEESWAPYEVEDEYEEDEEQDEDCKAWEDEEQDEDDKAWEGEGHHPSHKGGYDKESLHLSEMSSRLSLPLYFQYPELPTGCEVSALAMALGGVGYDIEPVELAKKYLDYGPDGDMLWKFQGDPFTEEGGGIFPPGLANTANAFLRDQKSEIIAYEATGCSFEEILEYSAEGHPVVLWVTLKYKDPIWVDDGAELDGISYTWYENEHCVALRGYDLEDSLVLLADSSDGYTEVDLEEFWKLYDQIQYAIVLM